MIHLLSHKEEAITKLNEFVALTKNKLGKEIKTIRTDNTAYLGDDIENYLRINGIRHQLSVSYCSSQNSEAERKKNTHLTKWRVPCCPMAIHPHGLRLWAPSPLSVWPQQIFSLSQRVLSRGSVAQ